MTNPGHILAKKMRPRTPARGVKHGLLEVVADDLFRKSAKAGLGLDLRLAVASAKPVARADAFAGLPAQSARFLLRSGDGGVGLIVPDGTVIDALIEFQTLGRVAAHPRGDRAVTRVDATMVEPLLVHVIGELAQKIAGRALGDIDHPFALGAAEFDAAQLDLTLLNRSYDILTVTLDFGPGVKSGDVQIWLPGGAAVSPMPACKVQNPAMAQLLGELETGLRGHIRGLRTTVGDLAGLKPGATLDLKPDLLRQIVLSDASGRDVLTARLGQLNGARAVCITGKPGTKKSAASADLDEFDDIAPGAVSGIAQVDAPQAPLPEAAITADNTPPSQGASDVPDMDMPKVDTPDADAGDLNTGDDDATGDFNFAAGPMTAPD